VTWEGEQGVNASRPGWTLLDLPALHDALDSATSAALAAEGGDHDRVSWALLEASSAAASAFPAGSREAEALGVILSAIGRAVPEPEVQPVYLAEPELGD
jgi:hypothetical protein